MFKFYEKVPLVNSEVLVDFKNIENPEYICQLINLSQLYTKILIPGKLKIIKIYLLFKQRLKKRMLFHYLIITANSSNWLA